MYVYMYMDDTFEMALTVIGLCYFGYIWISLYLRGIGFIMFINAFLQNALMCL